MLRTTAIGTKLKWIISGGGTTDVHPGVLVNYAPEGVDDKGRRGAIVTAVMLRHTIDGVCYLTVQKLIDGLFLQSRNPAKNDATTGDAAYDGLDGFTVDELFDLVDANTLAFAQSNQGGSVRVPLEPVTA